MKNFKILLKCIFVPFYWHFKLKKEDPKYTATDNIIPILYGTLLSVYIFIKLILGLTHANIKSECLVRSIGDVMLAPVYTIGCNLGKDRFNIKLN